MHVTIRKLISTSLAALALCISAAHAAYPESTGVGVIETVELEKSSIIVNGLRFRVALDADVTINGTFGALQMLTAGMLVRYRYLVISPTERQIIELETRPPNEPYEAS